MKKLLLDIVRKLTRVLEGTGIGKIKPFFGIYTWILSLVKPRMVVVKGNRILLDRNDSLLLSVYPNFEPGVAKVINTYVKPGMKVVDAGAHIGVFTLSLARLVGATGRVYAFEPDRINFELLRKNVELNNLKNVILENKALCEKSKMLRLYKSSDNPQDHRIFKDDREKRKYETVEGISLDSYFRRGEKMDFIKMDIQGSEWLAIKGAKKLMRRSRKLMIVFEFWPYGLLGAGSDPSDITEFLSERGELVLLDQKTGKLGKFEANSLRYDENFSLELFFKSS